MKPIKNNSTMTQTNTDAGQKKIIKSDFRLKGLSAPKSGTLELLHTDAEIFWCPFDIPDDRFKALFNFAKKSDNFWKPGWIAEVVHEGLNSDGLPINGRIVSIREWDINMY
jgi:hypothetical protein